MDSVYQDLVARAHKLHLKSRREDGSYSRTIVALAGPPGSGKSTIAAEVARRLDSVLSPTSQAAVLPMDGFHLPRSALDLLPNRNEAYERRGAAWTFDAKGVINLVERLVASKYSDIDTIITAPAFDHARKDPMVNAITITPGMSLVIIEGLWLLYDVEPWRRISSMVDDTWFVDVEPSLALERVARRHLLSGIEDSWEKAVARARGNDLSNGEEVRVRLVKPGVVVWSMDDVSSNSRGTSEAGFVGLLSLSGIKVA